jgi:hypothetical protein
VPLSSSPSNSFPSHHLPCNPPSTSDPPAFQTLFSTPPLLDPVLIIYNPNSIILPYSPQSLTIIFTILPARNSSTNNQIPSSSSSPLRYLPSPSRTLTMTVIFYCPLVVSRYLPPPLPPVSSTPMPFLPSLFPSAIPPHTSHFSRLHTVLSPFSTLSTLSFSSSFSPAHQTPHRQLPCHLSTHPPISSNRSDSCPTLSKTPSIANPNHYIQP